MLKAFSSARFGGGGVTDDATEKLVRESAGCSADELFALLDSEVSDSAAIHVLDSLSGHPSAEDVGDASSSVDSIAQGTYTYPSTCTGAGAGAGAVGALAAGAGSGSDGIAAAGAAAGVGNINIGGVTTHTGTGSGIARSAIEGEEVDNSIANMETADVDQYISAANYATVASFGAKQEQPQHQQHQVEAESAVEANAHHPRRHRRLSDTHTTPPAGQHAQHTQHANHAVQSAHQHAQQLVQTQTQSQSKTQAIEPGSHINGQNQIQTQTMQTNNQMIGIQLAEAGQQQMTKGQYQGPSVGGLSTTSSSTGGVNSSGNTNISVNINGNSNFLTTTWQPQFQESNKPLPQFAVRDWCCYL
jgi:hypothetical protein